MIGALASLLLAGCATHATIRTPPQTVVVLGNKTIPSICDPTASKRADEWRSYALTLEAKLGIKKSARSNP